jgi:hypothetical protein
MKLHLLMYLGNIVKDIKSFSINSKLKTDNNILTYNSELVEKIELSIEMIFEIIFTQSKQQIDLFDRKKYIILALEFGRLYCRMKELMGLDKTGFDFYIQRNIYQDQIIEMTEDEINTKLTPKE